MKKMNIAIAACSAMLLASGAHAAYTYENSMKINSCAQGVNLEVTAELPCYKDPSPAVRYKQNCESSALGQVNNVCVVGVDININNTDEIYEVKVSPAGKSLYVMFPKAKDAVGTAKNKFHLSVYPKGQATQCSNNMYYHGKENTYVLCWGSQ